MASKVFFLPSSESPNFDNWKTARADTVAAVIAG